MSSLSTDNCGFNREADGSQLEVIFTLRMLENTARVESCMLGERLCFHSKLNANE